jgi:Tfp pilus assembly protein PilF
MVEGPVQRAIDLFQKAYQLQMQGELEMAITLYRESLAVYPTAEAHTFLGWTYRFQGKLAEAIEECKKAITVDPAFGNPYNDIGVYLIEQGQPDEAIPWLEKATTSERYDPRHYPWYNLGRIYVQKEMYSLAKACFQRSVDLEPRYTLAREALERVRKLIQ